MPPVQETINRLECSLQSSSSSQRLQMLRSVTDLFLGGLATYSEEHIELFDQVLDRLIGYIETEALARLSSELAPIGMAPIRVVQRLARHDDIAVSAPLLRESKRLGMIDLIEVACTKSQAHLAAIARRSEIEEPVTDILVEKGNADVAKILAANSGARFSNDGFTLLVTRAEKEIGLAELVSIRSEMSPHHFSQLVSQASSTVRRRLMSISDPRIHAKITKVVTQIAREVNRAGEKPVRDFSVAQDLIHPMREDVALLRSKLAEFSAKGKFEETVVCLAVMGEFAPNVIDKLMTNEDDGGILLLCKGVGLDWPTTRAVISIRSNGNRIAAANESRMRFDKLSASTARRVLRFWRLRTSVATPASD
jgi:hypothetical protein